MAKEVSRSLHLMAQFAAIRNAIPGGLRLFEGADARAAKSRMALYRKLGNLPGNQVVIEWGTRPRGPHKYGGKPGGRDAPPCLACKKPFQVFLDLSLEDPQLSYLELKGRRRVFVLSCVRCDAHGAGELFYTIDPETHVIKILEQWGVAVIDDGPDALPEWGVRLEPLAPNLYPTHYKSEEEWRTALDPVEISQSQHRLGGYPFIIQPSCHIMDCVRCGHVMRYLGQVDTESPPEGVEGGHMFGDLGILYFQYCDSCEIFSTGADYY